jgi:F-type H+-transporting ATPase subunit beta
MKTTVEKNVGTIIQIIGPVMDIQFSAGILPSIYNALII